MTRIGGRNPQCPRNSAPRRWSPTTGEARVRRTQEGAHVNAEGACQLEPDGAAGLPGGAARAERRPPEPRPGTPGGAFRKLGKLGYKFIFITLDAAHAGMHATWNALDDLVCDEKQAQWRLEKTRAGHPTGSHHVMARVAHFQELERRYLPGAEERRPTGLAWSTRW